MAANMMAPVPFFSRVKDYYHLTKPGIVMLVLATTLSGMWLAAPALPQVSQLLLTLMGTGLAAAAGAVFNNIYDSDIDQHMIRTQQRALPAGRLPRRLAVVFALFLAAAALVILAMFINLTAMFLAAVAMISYALVYTVLLKRRSHLCTEIGGIAGAIPPMIGWVAATGELTLGAWVLFAIMFLWQPPHFWALASIKVEEYRAVSVPMLPVTLGVQATKQRMLHYTVLLVLVSILPYFLSLSGIWYLFTATFLGVIYLGWTILFYYRPITPLAARRLFFYSIFYLFILFIVMALDAHPVSIERVNFVGNPAE